MCPDSKTELDKLDLEKSVLMSEYLGKEWYGVFSRNEIKRTALISELANVSTSYNTTHTGGKAEGSALRGESDIDTMRVIQVFRVSEDNNMPFSDCDVDGVAFICIKRSEQFPGFCKLQLSQECYYKLQKRLRVINATKFFRQTIASVINRGWFIYCR